MKKITALILALCLITSLFTVNALAVDNKAYLNIYVSPNGNDENDGTQNNPFKTIERAKQEVEKQAPDMKGDIVVNILPGNYSIDETLVFDTKSSGRNGYNVIYKGVGNGPVVVNGGTKITGWADADGDGIWSAPANVEDTRTLYINDYPAQRAVSKYLYTADENYTDGVDAENYPHFMEQSDGFKMSKENFFANFKNPAELELVWPLEWTHQRTPVEDIVDDPEDNSKLIFKMKQPAWDIALTKENDSTNPLNYDRVIPPDKCFYIENAIELLDEPGEFYFDKSNKTIYYLPYEQEDLKMADTYVGTTDLLVKLQGNGSDDKIENVIFDNIEFKYGSWNDATYNGVVVTQTDHLAVKVYGPVGKGGLSLPAQFTVEFANNIQILNCKFIALGSSAIKAENGVSNSLIQGNIIKDVSGTGIMIDSYEHTEVLDEGKERCDNVKVINNAIHRAASEYMGMPAISMYLPSNSTVAHNDIKRTPYSGIVLGWGWGGYDCLSAKNNVVLNNKIEDVTNYLHDGGHIYTLDTIPDLKIAENYLVDANDWRGGIYLDSGSEDYTIERNVVEDSMQWFFARSAVKIKDIVAKDNFYDFTCGGEIDRSVVEYENNTPVEKSADGKVKWPEEAQKIIANAGLEAEYEKLLDVIDKPSWRRDAIEMQPSKQFAYEDELWIKASDYNNFYKLENKAPVLFPGSIVEGKYVPIGQTLPGEWVEYDVTLTKDAQYTLQVGYSNGFPETDIQPKLKVYLGGEVIVDCADMINTGNWDTYVEGDFASLKLKAGTYKLKFEFADNGFSFAKFRLYNPNEFDGLVYDEALEKYRVSKFYDVRNHWAEEDINNLTNKGIIKGVSDTEFAPEDSLTLYQAVWLVSRCVGIEYNDDCCWKEKAESHGLMDKTREDAPISREEFADIVIKGYKNIKADVAVTEPKYPDSKDISEEFKTSVGSAVALGFVKGDENGLFNPKSILTRAEAATVIARLLNEI